jgi:hypothetical protein
MTEAAEQVQALRTALEQAQQNRAAAMAAAKAAANALIAEPSLERRQERDQVAANIEIYDLRVEQARRQLRVAEIAAHEEAIGYLGAEHGDAQREVGDICSAIEGAVATLEGSVERGAALRRNAQRKTGRAREHHALAGLPDEDRPSFMIALPRTNQVRARLAKVIEQLQRLEIPNCRGWHGADDRRAGAAARARVGVG